MIQVKDASAQSAPAAGVRLAIMQPYLFPYLGYWQLLAAVDKFVILDDVCYINRGWINRNRIAIAGRPAWLTVPLLGASQNRLICDIDIVPDDGWKARMLRTVSMAYARAPEVETGLALLGGWLPRAAGRLSGAIHDSLQAVAGMLGIDTEIVPSSRVYPKNGLAGQARILDICQRVGATCYVNLPGGQALYEPAAFAQAGIDLAFLQPELHVGRLRSGAGDGAVLSILDAMMHNSLPVLAAAVRDGEVRSQDGGVKDPMAVEKLQ